MVGRNYVILMGIQDVIHSDVHHSQGISALVDHRIHQTHVNIYAVVLVSAVSENIQRIIMGGMLMTQLWCLMDYAYNVQMGYLLIKDSAIVTVQQGSISLKVSALRTVPIHS